MTWLNWPNRVTVGRTLLLVPLVICLLNLNEWAPLGPRCALALWLLMGVGDAVDGYLARRLKQVTDIGSFLDQLCDKLMVTGGVILLAFDATAIRGAELPNWVPVITMAKDLILTIGFTLVYLTTDRRLTTRPRLFGKLCTLLQYVMVAAILASPDLPSWWAAVATALWWSASAAAIAATVDYVIVGNRFVADWQRQTPPTP